MFRDACNIYSSACLSIFDGLADKCLGVLFLLAQELVVVSQGLVSDLIHSLQSTRDFKLCNITWPIQTTC